VRSARHLDFPWKNVHGEVKRLGGGGSFFLGLRLGSLEEYQTMQTLILTRHAHAVCNADAVVSCARPGEGLSGLGVEQALGLREAIVGLQVDLGVCTQLLRTQETLELALAGRDMPTLVVPELNEIDFGRFEGGPFAAYIEWARASDPDVEPPGGGESRSGAARRFAAGLEVLLGRREESVLVVAHGLALRYVLDASERAVPAARVEQVAHATPYALDRARAEVAAETLRRWADAPRFADTPFG